MSPEDLCKHHDCIAEHGYTILPDVIAPSLADRLCERLHELEDQLNILPAKNSFEGAKTYRIYNLLAHGSLFAGIPVQQDVLAVVEGVLDDGCLISSLSSIAIEPGEREQPIHADDQLIPLPKPHPAVVCNSMWALSDFSDENGATRIVPGSHLYDHSPAYGISQPTVPAVMRKGSVMIYHGSLWHGGGANRSNARRTGIAMNYCAGYIRQQENQQLGLSTETVRSFPPRLQELVGYGTYRGLIGHIDRKTPAERLAEGPAKRMVWDLS